MVPVELIVRGLRPIALPDTEWQVEDKQLISGKSQLPANEAADCHVSCLGAQTGNHHPREVDAVDRQASPRRLQCDASGPDAQLQSPAPELLSD